MAEAERTRRARTAQLLRTLRVGDRIATTVHSASTTGTQGVVVDLFPFSSDGERRIRVRLDGESHDRQLLPSSIERIEA